MSHGDSSTELIRSDMINKLFWTESSSFSAPENLATEAFLSSCAAPGEIILFLWQNEKTVVIGRNQNAWKECRTEALFRDGGTLVRRLSGGGAVFHDLGNLNISFCVSRAEEDIPRQTRVILNALAALGVQAVSNGRNDLELDGRKFSGHAFYRRAASSCHHATVMLKVDRELLEKYLYVSPLKLRSRGVDSVRSRVVNLADRFPGLTPSALCAALKDAFSAEYALKAEPFPWEERLTDGGRKERRALLEQFSSWDWTFGRRIPFDLEEHVRFPWGEVTLQLRVNGGRILNAKCWTDAMDPQWTENMEKALQGVRFAPEAIRAVFASLPPASDPRMRADLENLLLKIGENDAGI